MLEDLEKDALFPKVPRGWIIGAVGLGIVCAGLWGWSCAAHHQVAAHVRAADTDHQAAAGAHSEAVKHDDQALKDEAQQGKDDAQAPAAAASVAQAGAEVARVRKALALVPRAPLAPGVPDPEPVAPPVDLAPLVAALDAQVQALEAQHALDIQRLVDRDKRIASLSLARDSWRLSAQESAAEAVQLRAALAAQQGLAKSQRWMGRIEGLAVGLGGGYVAGRLR